MTLKRPSLRSGALPHVLAIALYKLGVPGKALESAATAVRQPNVTHWAHMTYTSLLGHTDQVDRCAAALSDLLALKPDCSCGTARQDFEFYDDPDFIDHYVAGLSRAGLAD